MDWVKAVEGSVIPALSERVNPKVGMVIPWSFARPSDSLVAEGAGADAEVSVYLYEGTCGGSLNVCGPSV